MPISSDLHLKVVLESGKAVKGKIYVPISVFQVPDLHLVNIYLFQGGRKGKGLDCRIAAGEDFFYQFL